VGRRRATVSKRYVLGRALAPANLSSSRNEGDLQPHRAGGKTPWATRAPLIGPRTPPRLRTPSSCGRRRTSAGSATARRAPTWPCPEATNDHNHCPRCRGGRPLVSWWRGTERSGAEEVCGSGGGDDLCSVVKEEEVGIRVNDVGLKVIGARLSPVSTPSLSPLPPPHSSATPTIPSPPPRWTARSPHLHRQVRGRPHYACTLRWQRSSRATYPAEELERR
jgi:hypothetical protein